MKYLKSGKKILALLLVITIVLTNVPLTLLSVEAEETTKLTVEWSEDSFNYDGTAKIPTATITDNVIEGGIDNGKLVVNSLETRQILIYDYLYVTMSITSGENVNAGDFTVTLTLSGNDGSKYSLDVASKEYTISQKSLASEATVDIDIEEDSYYYTGSEVKPEVTSVTVDGERWIETTDYEVSYSNNIATGTNTASVVIIPETDGTNSKNYTDTARESFSIVYLTVDGDVTVTSTTGSGGAVNNYYTSATFTAPDDFYIRQVTSAGASIEGQNWGTSFTVISSIGIDNGEVYYQLKNSDDALTDTTKYSTATYYIDSTPPEIGDISVSTDWADSKTVTIPVTEDNVQSVTYSVDSGEPVSVDGNSGIYSFTLTDEHDETTGKEYTITVTDKAGNTDTEIVTVKKIDTTDPTVTVKQGEEAIEANSTVYVNEETDFTVSFADVLSGIDASTLKIEKSVNSATAEEVTGLNWESSSNSTTLNYVPTNTDTETVVYTITGKDQAGNEVTKSFTVVYDTVNPTLDVFTITDTKGTAVVENVLYAYNDTSSEDVTVKVTISEAQAFDAGAVRLEYSSDGGTSWNSDGLAIETAWATADDGVHTATYAFDGMAAEDNTYQFRVSYTDKAGNQLELGADSQNATADEDNNVIAHNISVVIDHVAPVLTANDVKISTTGWSQEKTITITPTETNLNEVFYSHSGLSTETQIKADEDGVYSLLVDEELNADGHLYKFTVTDKAGNTTTLSDIKVDSIDRTAPSTDKIYISTSLDDEDSEEKTLISSLVNLFAKNKVKVTVYVADPTIDDKSASGVSEIILSYNSTPYTLEDSGTKTVIDGIDYDVFTVEIETTDSEVSDHITITSIKDAAGNACDLTAVTGTPIESESGNLIYIDDVAPELTEVDYATDSATTDATTLGDGITNNYWFYNGTKTLGISIDETNFFALSEENGEDYASVPTVKVGTDDQNVTWTKSGDVAEGTVTFAEAESAEKEYTFTVDYLDPSGNQMVSSTTDDVANYVVTDGMYSSDIIVIDTKAPELVQFDIAGSRASIIEDSTLTLYAENIDGNDITITVGIEDSELYFDGSAVKLEYSVDGDDWVELTTESEWTFTEEVNSNTYVFDGVADKEDTYQFRITYTDRAGNAMVENLTTAEGSNGIFTHTTSVVIDHKAPEVTAINFGTPKSIYDGESTIDTITDASSHLYYDGEATVSITLSDEYLFTDESVITLYSRDVKATTWDNGTTLKAEDVVYSEDGMISFTLPSDEAEYKYEISYADRAGNKMVYSSETITNPLGEAYTDGILEGIYTTPILVVDTTEPTVEVTYTAYDTQGAAITDQKDVSIDNLNMYQAGNKITATIKITATDLSENATKLDLTASDITGNTIDTAVTTAYHDKSISDLSVSAGEDGTYTVTIDLTQEAIYTLGVTVQDKVGTVVTYNMTDAKSIYLDRTVATITPDLDSDNAYTDISDIQYEVTNTDAISQFLNKITFGFFANSEVEVTVTAHDEISGVNTITLVYDTQEDEDGTDQDEKTETVTATVSEDDASASTATFRLPLSFKGTVAVYATDNSENVSDVVDGLGVIAQTEDKDEETSTATVEVVTSEAKTENYFNTDVVVKYSAQDTYSGISSITYVAGIIGIDPISYGAIDEEIQTDEVVNKYTISADKNNNNNVTTGLTFTDNAGYVTTVAEEDLPTIHIDTTVPTIDVEYDNNTNYNTDYYNETRTATITITERNFDLNDTYVIVTGGDYKESGWVHVAETDCTSSGASTDTTHSDACTWVKTVEFTSDGDYVLKCTTTDLAGNTADEYTESFVIDLVAPVLSDVTYNVTGNENVVIDSQNYWFNNDSVYVGLQIDELNFFDDMDATIPAFTTNYVMGDGIANNVTYPDTWAQDGIAASAKAIFAVSGTPEESEYSFTLAYTDIANNDMVSKQESEVDVYDVTDGTFSSDVIVLDTIAPELVEFSIKDTEGTELDGNFLYAKNAADDDIEITVVIDDNAKYFNSQEVVVEYKAVGIEEAEWTELEPEETTWEVTDREHTNTYKFDGDSVYGEEVTYQFRVSYTDRAGNEMVEADENSTTVEGSNGTFVHDTFVAIDHVAPEMTDISFTTPVVMYDDDTSVGVNGNITDIITNATTRVYYDDNMTVNFTLVEGYLFEEECAVTLYQQDSRLGTWSEVETITDLVKGSDGKYSFTIPQGDAEYYFTISYVDRAGNMMIYSSAANDTSIGEAYTDSMDADGIYTAPIIVQDNTVPVIDVTYTAYDTRGYAISGQEDVSISELNQYQSGLSVVATVTVTEQNLELDNTYVVVTQEDINGNDIGDIDDTYSKTWAELLASGDATVTKSSSDEYVLTIRMDDESVYTIEVVTEDKVGKTASYSSVATKEICVDRTTPEITVVVDEEGFFTSDSDIQYEVVNGGTFANLINKITFGYFSQEAVQVTITAYDDISGVDAITYIYDSEENESGIDSAATTVTKSVTLSGDKSETTISFVLPLSFKGTIKAYGTDKSANVADASSGLGVISETATKDAATADATITVLTNELKTENYYNTDVVVQYSVFDTYSGLNRVQYVAGSVDIADVDYSGSGVVINTNEIVKNFTIVANVNNNNNVETALSFTDNVGYVTTVTEAETPTIHIDITDPVISVEYNNNDVLNETYYSEPRTATITIKERNFDPNDTELIITGQGAVVSGWTNVSGTPGETDNCTWVATVTFAQDEDYTFTCYTVDLAGNRTDYGQTDEFTIDQTLPTIDVSYNNNESTNEYYYSAARTATITINEHNFNASEVEVTMTAADNGTTIAVPSVSGWSSNGDVHTASIDFDYDGEFTLDVAYADLAGNEAEDYAEDSFVVDLILPVIEILDIEDMSANNGVVSPTINVTDTNYDVESVVITFDGANNGEAEFSYTTTSIENGETIVYSNIPELVENDDLYTLTATATDKAGNVFESSVMFSVNRFGSVYILSEETEDLTEAYYTNEEITLHVQEINVDTIVFQEITYTKDSEVVTLIAGTDYTVDESGSDVSWKSYDYTIDATNFETEGAYVVTISSEDSATNQMNNKMMEADIEFAIDKTAPSTVVTGVEDDVQYNASTRELIVDAKDNMLLASVYVYINGTESVLEFKGDDLTENNGVVSVTLEDSNNWQTVRVVSSDAAGNKTEVGEITYLITTSMFYQWYRNTVLFYGSIVGAVAVVGGGTSLFAAKRRKKPEKK